MAASTGLHATCCSRCDQKSVEHNVQLVWLFTLRGVFLLKMNVIYELVDNVTLEPISIHRIGKEYDTKAFDT